MKKCKKCGNKKPDKYFDEKDVCTKCANKVGMTKQQLKEWNEKHSIVRSFPKSVEEAIGNG